MSDMIILVCDDCKAPFGFLQLENDEDNLIYEKQRCINCSLRILEKSNDKK